MTLNEYFAAGNHLLTAQMIEDNDLSTIFDDTYTGGLAALEHAARLKYGYSTMLPTSVADVQRAALGVILINRPKYDQWSAAIIHAVEYDPFLDYKMTETGSDTITKRGTVTDVEAKTNTGTQARQNGGSVQRTDALTETTQHGATNTHAKNSYNNGTLRDETRDTMGGSDTVNNTGTQTTTDTTTSTRTDNLTEQTNATKTNNLTDTHNILNTKEGFTKSPAETYAKNLAFFRRSMIMDMCDDICGYITVFDFNEVI